MRASDTSFARANGMMGANAGKAPAELTEAEEMLARLRAEYGNERGTAMHRAWLFAQRSPSV